MARIRKSSRSILGAYAAVKLLKSFSLLTIWLGIDQYSISLAVHSREGQAYDWLDAALFVRVTSMMLTEGIANLNASVTASHRALSPDALARERVSPRGESREYELWLRLKLKLFCARYASVCLPNKVKPLRPRKHADAGNGNRASESSLAQLEAPIDNSLTAEKLALINSHLVTLSRAWDRLPPLVSNRSGLAAQNRALDQAAYETRHALVCLGTDQFQCDRASCDS